MFTVTTRRASPVAKMARDLLLILPEVARRAVLSELWSGTTLHTRTGLTSWGCCWSRGRNTDYFLQFTIHRMVGNWIRIHSKYVPYISRHPAGIRMEERQTWHWLQHWQVSALMRISHFTKSSSTWAENIQRPLPIKTFLIFKNLCLFCDEWSKFWRSLRRLAN